MQHLTFERETHWDLKQLSSKDYLTDEIVSLDVRTSWTDVLKCTIKNEGSFVEQDSGIRKVVFFLFCFYPHNRSVRSLMVETLLYRLFLEDEAIRMLWSPFGHDF